MRAWQVTAAGAIEKTLRLTEVADPPSPKDGQVLVRVLTTGLNPADYKLLERLPGPLVKMVLGFPLIPGLDFSGRVAQLPPPASPASLSSAASSPTLHVDQLVFGKMDKPARYGPWGEFALVPLSGVVPLPAGLAVDDAAGVGTGAMTAYQALLPFVAPSSSPSAADDTKRVFINGGSGGTGVFAIQIAKRILGAHVTVSCSAGNAALCRDLGADAVIDYRAADLVDQLSANGPVFDLVVDLVGSRSSLHTESPRFLKAGGRFVPVAIPDHNFSGQLSVLRSLFLPTWLGGTPRTYNFFMTANDREQLLEIAKWLEDGRVKPVTDATFAFKDLEKAIARVRTGRSVGKVLVKVHDEAT